jgi:uncharacterized membrane protein YdfJ with MMPL/SSD domain
MAGTMSGGVFAGLARFVVRYRIQVAVFWGFVLVAATVALPSLGREVDSDPSLFLGSAARSVAASSLGAPLLGSRATSKITVVAARPSGPLTQADLAAITCEASLARQLSAVTAVRATALSPGRHAVQLQVSVSKDATDTAGLRPVVAALQETFPQAGLVFRYATPVWEHPGTLTSAASSLSSSHLFASVAGPLDPNGTSLAPASYALAHRALGNPARLPLTEPASLRLPASTYDAYRVGAQYVSADGRTVRFAAQLKAGGQQSTAAMDATPAVRAAVTRAAWQTGATASGVTGQAAALYDVSSTANADLTRIIPVAVLAIAILLGLVLRSLVAPVYLVISIVASYLAALGATTLLTIDLGGQGGLVFILPFLMFVFLLALGEDYNILVMTRIREEAQNLPLRQAVVRAIGMTGPTVTSAGLILAGTFGVFALAGGGVMGGQLQSIGLGLAVGVLLDTFVVRTLLVPSAVVLLGRWN